MWDGYVVHTNLTLCYISIILQFKKFNFDIFVSAWKENSSFEKLEKGTHFRSNYVTVL